MESQDAQPKGPLPAEVEVFLIELHNAVYDRNHELMKRLYEQDFNQITENLFLNTRWPSDYEVEAFYKERRMDNAVVTSLYRELYFRHVLARCSTEVQWSDRYLSSCNYMRLLEYFINEECRSDNVFLMLFDKHGPLSTSTLTLPAQWLWDMVDEFVYQFQETQRWKAQYADRIAVCETAMNSLRAGRGAWRGSDVFRILYTLIDASGVKQWLASNVGGRSVEPEAPVLLGYFSIISLMRLHVVLGDYPSALEVASPIELSASALYWKVPACHITLFYNLGFAYMMMRRYQDASRVLCQILTFVSKSRNYLASQSYQQDVMIRIIDRMYQLVMLCNALSPAHLDESIQSHIQERWADKYSKLQSDDAEAFKDIFIKACPKFFNPIVSDYEDPAEQKEVDDTEPLTRQLNMFLKDVSFQSKVFNVRSIAKLYNNLTLTKLANLMGRRESNAPEVVRSEMLCVKNRAEQLLWKSGPLLNGERVQMLADLDIYLELDTIHVKNLTVERKYAADFIKQIQRSQELLVVALSSSNQKNDSRRNSSIVA